VVYKTDPSGQETILYSFHGGADGWSPVLVWSSLCCSRFRKNLRGLISVSSEKLE
jgi:hypothetical protein